MMKLALAATAIALMVAPLGCLVASHVKESTVAKPSGDASDAGAGRAQCLVKIACDPNLLPLDYKVVESLVKSPSVGKEAAQEVFGEPIAFRLAFGPVGTNRRRPLRGGPADRQDVLVGRLSVEIFTRDAKPRADEFLDAVCRRLRQALQDAGDSERRHLQERVRLGSKLLQETELKIAALGRSRQDAAAKVGLPDPSRDRLLVWIGSLDSKKQSLEMSLAGKKARQAALAEQIAKLGAEARDKVKNDSIAKELAKIVAIREAELGRLRQAQAKEAATDAEVNAAEARLAEAKAKLAERLESAKGTGRVELLERLSSQLVTLGIDTAETEASLKALNLRLAKLRDRKVLAAAERYDTEIKYALRSAEKTRQELTASLEGLRRQLQTARAPTVTVIGRKPTE